MSDWKNHLHRFLNVWFGITVALTLVGLAYALREVAAQGYADAALLHTRAFTVDHIVDESRRTANVLGFCLAVAWLLSRRLAPHPLRRARAFGVLVLLGILAAMAGAAAFQASLDEDLNNLYGNYVDVDQFLFRTVVSSFSTSPPQVRSGLVFGFCFFLVVALIPSAFIERWVFRKPLPDPRPRKPWKAVWIGSLIVGVAVAAFTAPRSEAKATPGAPDIILISIDTLRADHLSLYGYSRETCPNLERFARDAVVVDHHMAHAPWTVPTHMSMFSGVIPSEHGVSSPVSAVDPKRTLFPERLKDQGYANGGFATNILLSSNYGYAAGFDTYVVNPNWNAEQVERPAVHWFLEQKGHPTFLFLHLFDVHYPYLPPDEYWGKFRNRNASVYEMQKRNFYTFFTWMQERGVEERVAVVALYDEGILYTDAILGRFFEQLRGERRYDDAWIIVTSDHGEEFHERGLWGHGITLYQEMLHVPLIVKAPKSACGGSRLTEGLVPQTAIHELILQASSITGEDDPRMACNENGVPKILADLVSPGPVVAEADMLGPLRYAALTPDRKLMEPNRVIVQDILDYEHGYEGYNLKDDPLEQHDVFEGEDENSILDAVRAFAPELREVMCRIRTKTAGKAKTERMDLDPATIQRLISLGYLSPSGDVENGNPDIECDSAGGAGGSP